MSARAAAYDFEQLDRQLGQACVTAFTELCRQHASETIYCAALYTDGPRSFLLPILLSEQGLDMAVEHYKTKLRYSEPRATLRSILRYMPEDSPYYKEGWRHFEGINKEMDAVVRAHRAIDSSLEPDLYDAFGDRLDRSMCAGLRAADEAGLFGRDLAREGVVLTVMMGDQDDTVFDFARMLNSPSTTKRFLEEWHKP